MKKTILIFVLNIVIGCLCRAQLPERNVVNIEKYKEICKTHIYKEMKGMYRQAGGSLRFPFLAPGSSQYLDMLWDWDSWLSDVALRQILSDKGTEADKREALAYEQGCVLNSLSYGGMDGWIPIWIERNAPSREDMLKKRNPWKTNMHKPTLAQHAAFIVKIWVEMLNGYGKIFIHYRLLFPNILISTGIKQLDLFIGKPTRLSE